MKEGWISGQLGELYETLTGGTPPKIMKHLYGNDVPFVKPPELLNAPIDSAEDNLSYEGAEMARVLPPKSILVSCIGNLGKVGMNTIPVAFNQQINAIKPNPKLAIPEFVFYQVMTPSFLDQLQKLSSGTTVPIVNKSKFNSISVCIPPLPEQKRIVAILDEAFEGISAAVANAEKNLANARELFESYLNAVFTQKGEGWAEKPLSEVCSITSKLVDPREPEYIDLPHIGAGNMVSMIGELVEVKTAREEGLKSGKFVFDEKMVLYSKIRPYLMKACRPNFAGLCSADVYPLSPNVDWLDRDFLFHLLMSRHFTDYAVAGSDRAGMPKVNRNHLFRYSVYLPDVSQQKLIATKFDELSGEAKRLEAIYRQKLTALAELKQSILQKAFAGELTAEAETAINKEAVA